MKSAKQVRFSTASPDIATTPQWYEDIQDHYLREGWWTEEEFKAIQESAFSELGSALDDWSMRHENLALQQRSYFRTMIKVHAVSMHEDEELSAAWTNDLNYWVGAMHSLRGLECFTLEEIECHRRQRKQLLLEAVLFVQGVCAGSMSHDRLGNMLREAAESVTKPATKLARMFGAADEEAAANGIFVNCQKPFAMRWWRKSPIPVNKQREHTENKK
eukprot:CAMPEP_0116835654 /NCGR_PEP_ID=MMETSP0418-20121206/7663_1 /TAXON_ID=1158023 /ORGANISM="Astrosyne radiata, Strain 13vi08-1A" /LENGTH=216 /DNA_ID=CAMNT_0004465341 /DNA_START=27 /DNA_END=673 /DNA_ORIENTATION=-